MTSTRTAEHEGRETHTKGAKKSKLEWIAFAIFVLVS